MIKQYTSVLILVAGLLVSALDAVPKKKAKKAPSSLTVGKVLGALGLAGAGAAGAYYAYDKDGATKKFEEGKKYLSEVRDAVVDYVKKADNRTIGLGIVGTAAASYLAYKLFIQDKEEDEVEGLAIEVPDTDTILNNLGTHKGIGSSMRNSKPLVKHSCEKNANWSQDAGSLLWQVFAQVKDEHKRRAVIKPYMEIAAQDPHQLIRDKKLVERLNDDQKLKLLQIMVSYTMDRIIKAAQALNESLSDEQEGVRFMLTEELAIVQSQAFSLRDLLQTLVTEKYISGAPAKFIKGELAIIKRCVEIQAHFSKTHNLDELLAKKLQPEKVQRALPARR